MKFDVKFASELGINGPGSVYLDETGILIEGDFPRFKVPVLHQILRQIICARGMRTIPYSRIVKYVKPSIWNRLHRIVYLLPNRKKQKVRFRMTQRRKSNDAEFSTRFQEYSTAAKTVSES